MVMLLVEKSAGEQLKEDGVLVLTDENFDQVTFILDDVHYVQIIKNQRIYNDIEMQCNITDDERKI